MKKDDFYVIVFAVGLALGSYWLAGANNLAFTKYFSPRLESVRREVFEQSKAYNQGMIQELQNMQFAYFRSDKEQRRALGAIILHRVADFDENKLPYDLKTFIQHLREEKTQ